MNGIGRLLALGIVVAAGGAETVAAAAEHCRPGKKPKKAKKEG